MSVKSILKNKNKEVYEVELSATPNLDYDSTDYRANIEMKPKRVSVSSFAEASEVASAEADAPSDIHASAEYRSEMVKVFVRRASATALERAKIG